MNTQKHRAEVIEIYPSEGRAAVRFQWRGRERVECVSLSLGPSGNQLTVGMRGWMSFHLTPSMGIWGFEPFKNEVQ